MLTALFITDCSIDSALLLCTWLSEQTHPPLSITIVHPYEISVGDALHKSVCQPAKADALARLNHWTAMLGSPEKTCLTTEILFSTPEVALTIHLMIRGYDYLIVDNWQPVSNATLDVLLEKTNTSVRSICFDRAPELLVR